jgi:hypothetical protein
MSDLRLYSVNWQDGMLITQQHLKDQERYLEELVQWHALRTGDNYGLIRKSFSGKPALNLNVSISGNRLRVEVVRCQAVTPDGRYIEINGTARHVVRGERDISETAVPVYIAVDPTTKKQIGEPDPGEDLPRVPYLASSYSVHLGGIPNLPQECFVQVAELTVRGSDISPTAGYYPPCINLYADERLAAAATDLRNRLENLLSLSTRAFRAITGTGLLAAASTSLQNAFKETINLFIYHLAATIDGFVVGPNAGHPMTMIIYFKRLFRVFSTLLNLHPGLRDYLNEKLLTKELGTDIGRFQSSIEAFILTEYNHQDIGGQIRMLDDILNTLRNVIAFLAQTKREELGEQAVATETLTYIGRTYRNVVYNASRLEQVGELSYLLIDVGDPRPASDIVVLMSKSLFADAEWRSMQVRLGINDARGLGETDPIDVDPTAFGNKVTLHPRDMLESSSVRQVTLIFRGAPNPNKFAALGKMDLIVYAMKH